MPHLPDRHTDHDLALVAASVTDDLTAAERTTVTELLAACAECTALQTDLRTLAAATASLPVPPRRRDYRITAEQAARLRPSGLRGILAAFGTKRFAFAAPLGTTMATLGLVGLLVAALPGPLAGGAASGPAPMAAQPAPATQDPAALSMPMTEASALPEGAGGAVPAAGDPSTRQTTDEDTMNATGDGSGAGDAAGDATATPTEPAGSTSPLLLLSSLAVATGLLLVILRWGARRATTGT